MVGKHGGNRRRLSTKTKSMVIYHNDELSTVALTSDLERKVSCLETENASIKHANRVLDTKFKEASTRIGQIEGKFNKAAIDIENLRNKNVELYNIIEKITPQRRFENIGKPFSDVGKRQQNRHLQTLSTRIEQALWFSKSFGLQLESVNLIDDSGENHRLSFGKKGLKPYEELSVDEQENVQQVLFIMDKFCIGEAAYHELTCCPSGEKLPRSYLIKQCKENLNKHVYIERTPGEAAGAALDFEDELRHVIETLVSTYFTLCNFDIIICVMVLPHPMEWLVKKQGL